MNISTALRRQVGTCAGLDVLGMAYAGSLPERELGSLWELLGGMSKTSQAEFLMRNLHRVFPHLGCSIRAWPKLAEELERERPGLLPPIKPLQQVYRREIHVSLWRVITSLSDFGQTTLQIADRLGRYGL